MRNAVLATERVKLGAGFVVNSARSRHAHETMLGTIYQAVEKVIFAQNFMQKAQ